MARLLRAADRPQRRARTTVAAPMHTPAPNLVAREFRAAAPDRLWLGDMTYVSTHEGWRYLAVLLDAYSRRLVGWALADHLRAELALDALAMALRARRPPPELVHHTAAMYRATLADRGITVSMSRAGRCLDNAVAESCFATPLAIFAWIAVWYNRRRRHSTLGYLTAVAHERQVVVASNRAA